MKNKNLRCEFWPTYNCTAKSVFVFVFLMIMLHYGLIVSYIYIINEDRLARLCFDKFINQLLLISIFTVITVFCPLCICSAGRCPHIPAALLLLLQCFLSFLLFIIFIINSYFTMCTMFLHFQKSLWH